MMARAGGAEPTRIAVLDRSVVASSALDRLHVGLGLRPDRVIR
jgi:hypothetical protein